MPRVSLWFVRASLLYLAVGFTLGALLLFNKGVPVAPALWKLLPAHVEFLVVGWTIQLVMGVAIWIFPRHSLGPRPRGSEPLAWLAFALLNGGVWLAGVGPLVAGGGSPWLPIAGRVAEVGAAVAFVANLWGRVKPFGLSEM